ncbi:hypothetical protein B0H13DRAFT_2375958 [Mycena leptocephala]|nr:hypothetical protein B0H13DRAFT_2375958 [Mycena leptocephala]
MTADPDNSAEYDDPAFIALLASLDLADIQPTRRALRTPSPRLQSLPIDARHTFPNMTARSYTSASSSRPPIYQFESPTTRGHTTEWSTAGVATQGVRNSHVHAIRAGCRSNYRKSSTKKAYAVFCGRDTSVFLTWAQTRPLVERVRNCLFRGYGSVAEADAAFAYAVARSWVRISGAPVTAIPALPQPIRIGDRLNPLNGSEESDGKWYVVYCGITPGVYRSHSECQLNTMGVRGALHQSVVGFSNALAKYEAAAGRHETAQSSPPDYTDVFA